MFNRVTCKQNGKEAFKRNYWLCVAAALIIALLCDGMLMLASSTDSYKITLGSYSYSGKGSVSPIFQTILVLLGIFVFSVINVGGRRFFMDNRKGDAQFSELFFGFSDGRYIHYVGVMFLMNLKIFLWSLLLFVPGIIKAYEYAMLPYIVADNPDMDTKSAFALSKQMMTGNKWNLFGFDVSFIGWDLLSLLTAGILGFLYVIPYKKAARAEVYYSLKKM